MSGNDPFVAETLPVLFEEAPAAMIVIDREGHVRMWNKAATQMTGWTCAETVGKPPPYIPREYFEGFRSRHMAAFAADAPLPPIVVKRTRKDGTTFDVAVARSVLRANDGTPFAVLGVLSDVTEKRREEEAQRRSEANFRTLIERAPDAIVVHRFGNIVFVNPRFVSMLGYGHAEELIGRPMMDFIHPDDHALVVRRREQLELRGQDTPPILERLLHRDGSIVHVEVIGLVVRFDGEPAVLAHARDLSERMRFEAELRARDRLASVGKLAAAVGHEINNPLAYVLGNLALVEQKLDSSQPSEARALLEGAREGAERVRLIVRDLKMFSQREAEASSPLDLARLLDSCCAMAIHEIRHRARLETRYARDLFVIGNEARLGQVFLNLLVNAGQAIGEGRVHENTVTVDAARDGDWVIVRITDTGVGISPEVRARAFEPFFTTKEPGRGTGLGLSICHSIVTALGGTIELTDASERGTTVCVRLPAAAAAPAPPIPSERPRTSGRRRVLVVDDEPRVARVLAALLEPDEAVVAGGAAEALAHLAAGERFDVVLCDLMMPRMSGMDLYERMQAEYPGLERRVVFMTGGAFTPRGAAFLASIPNDCLDKPFDAKKLALAIDRAARRG